MQNVNPLLARILQSQQAQRPGMQGMGAMTDAELRRLNFAASGPRPGVMPRPEVMPPPRPMGTGAMSNADVQRMQPARPRPTAMGVMSDADVRRMRY
jgi:hypothetical protein